MIKPSCFRYGIFILAFLCLAQQTHSQEYKTGPEEKDYVGYLFAYFKGNAVTDEAVCYAVSRDGYRFRALNDNQPILDSRSISSTGGVRDPHLLRCEDGKTFYMVLTDMTCSKGWDSNRAMVLLKSENLVDWTHSVVNIQDKYPNQEGLKRVWAPQTIFDPEAGKYMVYWSMKHDNGPDIIYYAYANKEFTDLEGEPKPFFVPENKKSCIDGDIVCKEGVFHMFYKTEGHGDGIKVATTKSLSSGKWTEQPEYKQQTKESVEGSCVFKLIGQDVYILLYDVYKKGQYQFCKSTDLENFSVIDGEISMDFKPRHGTVIPITRREMRTLTTRWGVPDGFEMPAERNPVLEGYYADPEILYSEKTGKYYIYPTSDGFNDWGGYYFKAFSSDNLTDWTDEGVILDLRKDVSWTDRNAWAPCMIERKDGNEYKYYFYFTAGQKIGVAVAEEPTGPFVDSGNALIDFKPEGVRRGQEIDPDVFFDTKSGKYYLYWGNGYLAVAELNDDMVSIKKDTIRVITPDNTFREGVYVFQRNGVYYFLWSQDDTRSENYSVRYGTSRSPLGPIEKPEKNHILTKDPAQGIFGTGHNSVLQIPGKDEWYIVYHRFSRPNGIKMGRAAGFHRETCIDPMFFDENEAIQIVKPTP